MSFQSKRELLAQTAPRYREASHGLKTQILDEFVAATGYARKYAIRLLTQPLAPSAVTKRSRTPRYGPAVQEALIIAWLAANAICAGWSPFCRCSSPSSNGMAISASRTASAPISSP